MQSCIINALTSLIYEIKFFKLIFFLNKES